MVVLLTGATGFIGRHLAEGLEASGHKVVCAVRDPSRPRDPKFQYVAADFTRDFGAADWLPRLTGVDVVINAVGIIRERGAQTFDAIHSRAPRALFSACAQAGVRRVIQISALGADENAKSRYHLSKKEADDFLLALPLRAVVVQPSLVYGDDGTSARLFTTLASLPWIALPGEGRQMVQPVHIEDVVATVLALLKAPPETGRLAAVGPEAMTLRAFLATLRGAMGLGPARFIAVPPSLVRRLAQAARWLPGSLFDEDTLGMLERGNTADAGPISRLLGRAPRPAAEFIGRAGADTVRLQAKLNWLLPILRASIALVWIVTGIVSLGLYPVTESYQLLARVGITGMLAPLMLYGAAAMDLAFGIGTLVLRRRRWLWVAQMALIAFYTVVISWKLPEFWLHPYGPILKNLPMIAAIWLLMELERR